MIIVAGTVKFADGALAKLADPMDAIIEASRAEAGCILYSFAFDVQDPTLLRIYEQWESREALAEHFKQTHMDVWRAAVAEAGESERDIKIYDVAGETTL